MRRTNAILLVLCALVAVRAASGSGNTPEVYGPMPDLPTSFWTDPTFQKQFLGSYGVLADLEPKVSPVERQQLDKVIPLISADPAAAAVEVEKFAAKDASAALDFLLANLYFQTDRPDAAAERYRAAIGKFPSFRRAHKNLGLIEFRAGKYDAAIQRLTQVVELGGGDGLTYGLLGYAYAATGQQIAAESAFRNAMMLQPDQGEWKIGLTQAVFRQRRYAEAAAMAEELIAKNPERAEFWLLQGNAYIGLEQPMRAAQNFEIVARMGKASTALLYTLGDLYVGDGAWALAAQAYVRAVEQDAAADLDRPIRMADSLARRGALEASSSLIAAIERTGADRLSDEDRRKLLKVRARIAVAEGHGEEAAKTLEEVVSLDPLDGDAMLLLGQHLARNGQPEKAIFYFERAASFEPLEAEAKVRQAQVLVGQSKYTEAVPLLKRAQEIKPREDVARFLEQVERVARSRR